MLPIAVFAGMLGCAHTIEPGQPFTLAVGDQARVSSATVALEDLVEDSRCPEEVQCIWAGQAKFAVALTERGERAAGEVVLPGEPIPAGAYTIELVEVAPAPTTQGIPKERYAATLVVRRAEP